MTLQEVAAELAAVSDRIDGVWDDEHADRQAALEEAQAAIDRLRHRISAERGMPR